MIIEKIENNKTYISLLINDKRQDIKFWIDCSLMDGFGHRATKDTEQNNLFIDWEFNQYIFNLDNSKDLTQKQYQEEQDNLNYISYFLDENNTTLVNYFIDNNVKYYD